LNDNAREDEPREKKRRCMTIAFKGEADVTGVEEPERLRSLLGFVLALEYSRGL
jgi:hypothetical protein